MGIGPIVVVSYGPQAAATATAPIYVHLNAFAKQTTAAAPYCIANEFICAEMGRAIRLPIPPFTIVRGRNQGN